MYLVFESVTTGGFITFLPITELKMLLHSASCLAHSSRAWLLWISLLILFLWLPFTSAFGISSGRPLKSAREVIGTRRAMLGTETVAVVADESFLTVLVLIAVPILGGGLVGAFLGYLTVTPSVGEIRSEMHNTNKRLEGLQTKLQSLNTKLQSRNPKKF